MAHSTSTRGHRVISLLATLATVAAVALIAAPAAVAAPPPVLSTSASSNPDAPTEMAPPSFVDVRISNAPKKASTGALSVSLSESPSTAGFSITSNGCSGVALGPAKSCVVRVSYAGTPTQTETATLTVSSKKPTATIRSYFQVSNPDTDGDGVADDADNCPNDANADQADNEGDSVGDVCDADDDNDGLSDIDEANGGTDPNDADSDDDGLSDGDEVNEHGTDPNDTDSDDDGLSDTDEVAFGSDPNNVCDPTGDGHDGCPTSDLVIDCPPGSCDDSTSSTDFPKFWGYLYTTGTFTITNNGVGGTAPLIIEMGGSATWSVTNNGCEGLPLGPGASCTFEVVINGDPCDIPDGIDVRGSGGFWYIRIGSPLPCTDD